MPAGYNPTSLSTSLFVGTCRHNLTHAPAAAGGDASEILGSIRSLPMRPEGDVVEQSLAVCEQLDLGECRSRRISGWRGTTNGCASLRIRSTKPLTKVARQIGAQRVAGIGHGREAH